jgi:hypothetical protein
MGNCFSNNSSTAGDTARHFPYHISNNLFRSQKKLDDHLKSHSGMFKCFKCAKTFEIKADCNARVELAEFSKR